MWLISNEELRVTVIATGACLYRVETRNKAGVFEDVVLSYESLYEYDENKDYLGAVVGRSAGRIRDARMYLGEQEYMLDKNWKEHHLHGGIQNFSQKRWVLVERDATHITLMLKDSAGSCGYPGNLQAKVTYTIYNNVLTVKYEGVSDARTLFDMTQHTYWNLSGNYQTDIKNHHLKIAAHTCIPLDETGMVVDSVMTIKEAFGMAEIDGKITDIFAKDTEQLQYGNGIDHPFILDGRNNVAAILYDESSGRKLTCTTDREAVVCYSGNFLGEKALRNHKMNQKNMGICFETQCIPNTINSNIGKQTPVLEANTHKNFSTSFQFDLV